MSLKDLRKVTEKVIKDNPASVVKADSNTMVHKICFDSPQLTYMFGGFSIDRIHQSFGPESSGKSSYYTYIAGQCQKHVPEYINDFSDELETTGKTFRNMTGKEVREKFSDKNVVVYLDFERTFDPNYAANLGLNCDDEHLILLQPDTLEEGASMALEYVKSGSVCCVILDSDAMAPTSLDLESDPGDTGFNGAKGANVLKQVYKNFNIQCSNYLTPLLVVSQERANLNVMSHLPSVTGGTAIRFAASTRNRVTKVDTLKDGTQDVGIQIRIRNYKNKTGTPWRDAIMNLYFNGGFKVDDEYFDFLSIFDIIHKGNGGVYSADFLPNGKIRGAENLKTWLTDPAQEALYDELKKKVMQKLLVKNELDANNVAVTDENGLLSEKDDESKPLSMADLANEAMGIVSEEGGDSPDLGLN